MITSASSAQKTVDGSAGVGGLVIVVVGFGMAEGTGRVRFRVSGRGCWEKCGWSHVETIV